DTLVPCSSTLAPSTTLFRSRRGGSLLLGVLGRIGLPGGDARTVEVRHRGGGEVAVHHGAVPLLQERLGDLAGDRGVAEGRGVDVDRKSTRLNPVTFRSRMPS